MVDMIKLRGSEFSGEGGIKISEKFEAYNKLLQIDLLKDWCYFLEKEYRERRDLREKEIMQEGNVV